MCHPHWRNYLFCAEIDKVPATTIFLLQKIEHATFQAKFQRLDQPFILRNSSLTSMLTPKGPKGEHNITQHLLFVQRALGICHSDSRKFESRVELNFSSIRLLYSKCPLNQQWILMSHVMKFGGLFLKKKVKKKRSTR